MIKSKRKPGAWPWTELRSWQPGSQNEQDLNQNMFNMKQTRTRVFALLHHVGEVLLLCRAQALELLHGVDVHLREKPEPMLISYHSGYFQFTELPSSVNSTHAPNTRLLSKPATLTQAAEERQRKHCVWRWSPRQQVCRYHADRLSPPVKSLVYPPCAWSWA